MLANKTLLGSTLAVTFLAGGFTGYNARRPVEQGRHTVEFIYREQFEELRESERRVELAEECRPDSAHVTCPTRPGASRPSAST